MNNSAFRDLISGSSVKSSTPEKGNNGDFKKPAAALGSRMRSSIPMTPRRLPGQKNNSRSEFARQVAEATGDVATSEGPPLKKFKSSAAPKGSRLASGYVDRAGLLRDGDQHNGTEDDKEKRLKALEEMYKLQQIDQATFENLKDQIGIGGDVNSTHLVRGLDWKLLARVRRGEDITKKDGDGDTEQTPEIDVDAEFDRVLESEVVRNPTVREQPPEMQDSTAAEPTNGNQQSLSRDEILRRFKTSRNQAPAEATSTKISQQPVLNDRFKKVPTKQHGPKKEKFVETVNGRRREVLLITNMDGSTKRKTRWLDPELTLEQITQAQQVEQEQKKQTEAKTVKKQVKKDVSSIMGMEVPAEIAAREAARKAAEEAAEEGDDDIFQGVGDDYDPLGDIKSDDSDESGNEGEVAAKPELAKDESSRPAPKRNYFGTRAQEADEDEDRAANPVAKDPTILAALKRAAEIRKREENQESSHPSETQSSSHDTAKSKAFLAKLRERDRQDAADLDMGFGGSRFDDEEDDDEGGLGRGAKLLDFHQGDMDRDDGEEGQTGKKGKTGRKRGPKKRKGDKNNFADVMGVIESRKK